MIDIQNYEFLFITAQDAAVKWEQEEKEGFIRLLKSLESNGIKIKYMKSPVDNIDNINLTASTVSLVNINDARSNIINSPESVLNKLLESKLLIKNNTMYIYKINKEKHIIDDESYCTYNIRIGK